MDQRNRRTPSHSASRRRGSTPPPRRQRLDDGYYYEEPSRRRGGYDDYDDFEDISSYSPEAAGRRKRDRREQQRMGRQAGRKKGKKGWIAFLLVLLILGGAVWYLYGFLLNGLTMKSINVDNLGISDSAMSHQDVKNIALFGLDAREDVDEGRSDALMILTVDNVHKKLKLTSILRDSLVSIEGYGNDKVTHAYAYGGPELAIKTLNQNFHLDIQDYVTVNFFQMAEIVDAFGGTQVNITYDEAMEINNNLSMLAAESSDANISESDFIYEEGDVVLNGNQAVAYARIRHLDSDDMRASRQQKVLEGLVAQLKTMNKLQYPDLIRKVAPMCETSIDLGDMLSMSSLAFSDMTMETLSIPGEEEAATDGYTDSGAWVYVYDLEAASQHISRFIYEENSPYSTSGTETGEGY